MASNHDRDMRRSVNLSPAIYVYSTILISGVFVIIVTPARVAQYSYDKARLLAVTPFGWLVLGLVIGKLRA